MAATSFTQCFFRKGNVYGILGPNGSGKSTTLGIVLNVVNKTSGEYSWFDGELQTHEALKSRSYNRKTKLLSIHDGRAKPS
jgi:ABC-type multidrug transport system ATPase subunit